MGYLSNVKIAVCLNDYKDFIKNLSDRNYISKYCDNKTQFFLGNRKKYQENIIEFVNDAVKDVREGLTGVEYQTLEWDGVKWYETEFIEIAYIRDNLIDKYDSNFVRVGEDPDDYERKFDLDDYLFDILTEIRDVDA